MAQHEKHMADTSLFLRICFIILLQAWNVRRVLSEHVFFEYVYASHTGCWFGTFSIFAYIENSHPN